MAPSASEDNPASAAESLAERDTFEVNGVSEFRAVREDLVEHVSPRISSKAARKMVVARPST
jgi:hypothetical protein